MIVVFDYHCWVVCLPQLLIIFVSCILSSVFKWVVLVCTCAQSCSTLWDPMDCSLPVSSVHGIFQERILERVAISFFRGPSLPRGQTWVSCIAGRLFTSEPQLFSILKSVCFPDSVSCLWALHVHTRLPASKTPPDAVFISVVAPPTVPPSGKLS